MGRFLAHQPPIFDGDGAMSHLRSLAARPLPSDRLAATRLADACQCVQRCSTKTDLLCSEIGAPSMILARHITRCTDGSAFSSGVARRHALGAGFFVRSRGWFVEQLPSSSSLEEATWRAAASTASVSQISLFHLVGPRRGPPRSSTEKRFSLPTAPEIDRMADRQRAGRWSCNRFPQ